VTRFRLIALLALAATVAVAVAWLPIAEWLAIGIAWVDAHPMLAWPVFVGSYVVATVLALPGSILTLAAGFVFGLPLGIALTSVASVTGATSAFLIGRYLARAWVEQRIESNKTFKALDAATRHEGFVIVFLARLSPAFPFNLLNYGLALTGVRLRDYFLASWIGMLPGTVLYVYLGAAAGDLSQLLSGEVDSGLAGQALLIGGLIATAVLTAIITRKASQALGRHLKAELPEQGETS
jgi:uncharacterized membrane protein YdjX (TVP38/TMEM64 family)